MIRSAEVITIKKVLKELRKEHNHTQENLAEILQVSRQTISNWETGKSLPDSYNVQLLTEVYGSDVLAIFNTSHDKNRKDKNINFSSEHNQTMKIFIVFLNFISLFIPFSAILSLYIVLEWKTKIPTLLFKLSYVFLALVSLLNVVGILSAIVFLVL